MQGVEQLGDGGDLVRLAVDLAPLHGERIIIPPKSEVAIPCTKAREFDDGVDATG